MFDFSRVVQLGWVLGRADLRTHYDKQNFYVKPQGFVVTPAATKHHGISQEYLVEHGHPLDHVLREFMQMATDAHRRGARICAHHLEFDAGIILREL